MEIFSSDIPAYFKATVFNWYFLGPGLVMIVLELLDKVGGWKAPGKTYIHLVFTACLVVAMFLTWRDVYHDNQRLSGELETVRKDRDKPIVKDDGSKAIITDLQQQLNRKDIEAQELKRLRDRAEDTASRAVSDNATLKSQVRDLQGKVDDKKTSIAEKAARHTHRDKFAQFMHEGMDMQQRCFNGLTQSPEKDFLDWQAKVLAHVKTTMSSSHVIRFTDTMINIRLQFFDAKRQAIPGICADTGREIEAKLVVLREFISELNN